jgi:diguanylate cyclase (GGDEF)-like protein
VDNDDKETLEVDALDAPSELGAQETTPPEHSGTDLERWESTDDVETDDIRARFQNSEERAHLVIISGARAGQATRLEPGETLLGRQRSEVDVWFRDSGVSRIHAAIEMTDDDEALLRDLDSSNGTYVDGALIEEPTPLHEGDKITLGGSVVLKFSRQDQLDAEFQRRMYESSIRDELTGTYSRSYLIEQMRSEMSYADRHDIPLALLFVDLDRFKKVNDTYGHVTGDEVLVELTDRILGELRDEDTLARYGGEEFAVLMREVAPSHLEELAERIRCAVASESFETDRGDISVTVSVGVAEYTPETMSEPEDWIRAADEAMYRAKEAGRNQSFIL